MKIIRSTIGLLAFFLLAAYAALAQPTLINHVASASGVTSAVNMTGASMIAIFENVQFGAPTIPTDNSSNTYVQVAQELGGGNPSTYLFVCFNPTVTSSMTFSVGSGGWPISVQGWSGVASGPDQIQGILGSSPSATTPSLTPTNANELILSGWGGQNSGTAITASVSPLTLADSVGWTAAPGFASIASGYQVQTTATPVSVTWTNNLCCGGAGLTVSFYSALSPAPLVITTANVPEGFVSVPYGSTGSLYSNQMKATGGVQPYVWTVSSGTLPTGMSLSSSGLLSGTPTGAVSARSITYLVTDAQSSTQSATLPITVAATALSLGAGTCTGSALNGTQYTGFGGCSLTGGGGTSAYDFFFSTLQGDYALPEGLSINASTGAITGTVYGAGDYPVTFYLRDSLGAYVTLPITFPIAGNYVKSGWQFFNNDTIFHLRVDAATSGLPVDTSVVAALSSLDQMSSMNLLTDVNTGGIPWARWPADESSKTVITQWPGYNVCANFEPFSLQSPDCTSSSHNSTQVDQISPFATIEATQNNSCSSTSSDYCGDGHSISVILPGSGPTTNPLLKEQYNAQYNGTQWSNHSDGNWDMTTYTMPLQDVGEATDEAGLPIAPFLTTYDEAAAGTIDHASRFTLNQTLACYVWPATAPGQFGACPGGAFTGGNGLVLQPGSPGGASPTSGSGGPLGEIYRIKASFSTAGMCSGNSVAQNIITGWRNYGIILADRGGTGYVTAAADSRWGDMSCLGGITLAAFEPVNVQSVIKTLDGSNLPTVSYQTTTSTPTVATPTFSPVAGSYGPAQTVTLSTSTGGASLVYTTDGTTPTVTALTCTITHGTLYSGSLTVSTSQTLNAIGCLSGDNASSVGSAAYVINGAASAPTFSPPAGTFTGTQVVSLSTSSGGCSGSIVWNTTGAASGGNLTGVTTGTSVTVPSSETVYSQVQSCSAFTNSSIASAAYVINPPPPPSGGIGLTGIISGSGKVCFGSTCP